MRKFRNGPTLFNNWQEMKKVMLEKERQDKLAGVVELSRFWSFIVAIVLFGVIYLISYDALRFNSIVAGLIVLFPDLILGSIALILLFGAVFGKGKKLEELTDREWIKMFETRRKMLKFVLKFRKKSKDI